MGSHLHTVHQSSSRMDIDKGMDKVKEQLTKLFGDEIVMKKDDCGWQFTHRDMIDGNTAYAYASIINGLVQLYC